VGSAEAAKAVAGRVRGFRARQQLGVTSPLCSLRVALSEVARGIGRATYESKSAGDKHARFMEWLVYDGVIHRALDDPA
jgi:hypothetical protein